MNESPAKRRIDFVLDFLVDYLKESLREAHDLAEKPRPSPSDNSTDVFEQLFSRLKTVDIMLRAVRQTTPALRKSLPASPWSEQFWKVAHDDLTALEQTLTKALHQEASKREAAASK
jgi:hypothetical protein